MVCVRINASVCGERRCRWRLGGCERERERERERKWKRK